MGLIGEEVGSAFKTYHFDYRGSTIAITNSTGAITDTFAYDTYGKQISRTGTSNVIFGYNGRDGVVTESNGLIYMRARYYSPEMRRFINADIIPGEISNAITLNRFAYANGNPVLNVDPFGLEAKLDEYINANYYGVKNVSLVINQPVVNSREVAVIENGKLNNGHSFIRLDDGKGNVQYIGFGPAANSIKNMILAKNVEGNFSDDSQTDWDVAKIYKLNTEQYIAIVNYIENEKNKVKDYNIENYNCTTFAVNVIKAGDMTENFVDTIEHNWKLPNNATEQLRSYQALPKWIPAFIAAFMIEITMGNFFGYTPADTAEDLKLSDGHVVLKENDSVKTLRK